MPHPDLFFLILLATVAGTRLWLYRRPMGSPTIHGFRMHHYMYGFVLVTIGLLLKNLIVYSIGFGLAADEIPLVLFSKTASWTEYESKKMFTALLVVLVLIFIFRNALVPVF